MKRIFRIGTRGSELALAQATLTEAALAKAWPDLTFSRVIVRTTGDARLDVSLKELHHQAGLPADKGAFTKELETALLSEEIDIVVHSLKDVPTQRPAGLEIAAALPRAQAEDVLITKHAGGWAAISPGKQILTGSPRRERLIRWLQPGLSPKPVRGNVPTRIRKFLEDPESDGIILARAGLERLGMRLADHFLYWEDMRLHATILPLREFPHAVGQAVVGLEIRSDDDQARTVIRAINHEATFALARMERAFLRLLDAGCHTPVGVVSKESEEGFHLSATVFDENLPDAPPALAEAISQTPESAAEAVFRLIRNA